MRKKANLHSLTIATGTMFDKKRLLDNLPTAINADLSTSKKLADLKAQFEAIANRNEKVIEGEVLSD